MSIRFRKDVSEEFLREQLEISNRGDYPEEWRYRFAEFSDASERVGIRTHIAFLGTSLLAKAINPGVDLMQIKPSRTDSSEAYSARSLCHKVLVPLAIELGINLGVTGREPLNNQPYFRMNTLDDGTPMREDGKPLFETVLEVIDEINSRRDQEELAGIFRAWLADRTERTIDHGQTPTTGALDLYGFPDLDDFVRFHAQGGKVAQALAAGICDAVYGPAYVVTGRINDPSRRQAGDVGIVDSERAVVRAIEVREKRVSSTDCFHFMRKCLEMGVTDAIMLAAAREQDLLSDEHLSGWATRHGGSLQVVYGLQAFVTAAVLWSTRPLRDFLQELAVRCYERLVEVEATSATTAAWIEVTGQTATP